MKRLLLSLACTLCVSVYANNVDSLKNEISALKQENSALTQRVKSVESKISTLQSNITSVTNNVNSQKQSIDSVNTKSETNSVTIKKNAEELGNEIKTQNETFTSNVSDINKSMGNKTIGFIIILVVLIIAIIIYILLAKKKSSSTDKTISLLQSAQKSLEEQSVKLDNQLIEILEKKMKAVSENASSDKEPDHSLPLKVADEIVRIQNNIDRMDASDKNVGRLNKALERMKSSFTAYGYEIVDMRGQEYTDNMPFEARFIPDDTIEEGKRIISGMDRLMVRYNGKMIQAPILAVRQNV